MPYGYIPSPFGGKPSSLDIAKAALYKKGHNPFKEKKIEAARKTPVSCAKNQEDEHSDKQRSVTVGDVLDRIDAEVDADLGYAENPALNYKVNAAAKTPDARAKGQKGADRTKDVGQIEYIDKSEDNPDEELDAMRTPGHPEYDATRKKYKDRYDSLNKSEDESIGKVEGWVEPDEYKALRTPVGRDMAIARKKYPEADGSVYAELGGDELRTRSLNDELDENQDLAPPSPEEYEYAGVEHAYKSASSHVAKSEDNSDENQIEVIDTNPPYYSSRRSGGPFTDNRHRFKTIEGKKHDDATLGAMRTPRMKAELTGGERLSDEDQSESYYPSSFEGPAENTPKGRDAKVLAAKLPVPWGKDSYSRQSDYTDEDLYDELDEDRRDSVGSYDFVRNDIFESTRKSESAPIHKSIQTPVRELIKKRREWR